MIGCQDVDKKKSMQFTLHGSRSGSMSSTEQTLLCDIERVKEEKKVMRELLERGVTEAECISKRLSRLSEEIHRVELRGNELTQVVREMSDRYTELQQKLDKMNAQLTFMQRQTIMKEKFGARQETSSSILLNKEYDLLLKNHTASTKKVKELRDKLALLETAETTIASLATCSRHLLHGLGRISAAVNSAGMCEELRELDNQEDCFEVKDEVDNARNSRVVFTFAKAAVDSSDSCLCTIWSGLCRIASDQVCFRRQQDIQFSDVHMVVERDFTMTAKDCAVHLRKLENELEMWEDRVQKVERLASHNTKLSPWKDVFADFLPVSATEKPDERDDRKNDGSEKSLLAILKRTNESLQDERSQLKLVNETLQNKLEVSASDYRSIRELKHAYRKLEITKTRLAYVNEELCKENRRLKLNAWELGTRTFLNVGDG